MRPEIFLPLALLFLAYGVPSKAQSAGETTTVAAKATTASEAAPPAPAPVSGSGLEQDVPYDVGRTFSLNCTSAGSPVDNAALSYVWKKNGTSVESVWDLAGRYTLEEPAVFRMTKRTLEDDFGVYTCEPAGGATVTFRVRGRPYAKLAANTNVVEDTKLKIVCKVVGKPHPRVTWRFANASLPGSGSNETSVPIAEALGARVTLSPNEQGVVDAQLQVEAAARSDAAVYTCLPEGADVYNATTTLRVKDKYAALWPFLGICAEVFVLCAIILVYERRRTKPELDDSDTDNHDQKKS